MPKVNLTPCDANGDPLPDIEPIPVTGSQELMGADVFSERLKAYMREGGSNQTLPPLESDLTNRADDFKDRLRGVLRRERESET
jgi:hypothetical protein